MSTTAQDFVNALNAKLFPQLGYVFRNNRWEFPNTIIGQWTYREKFGGALMPTGEPL